VGADRFTMEYRATSGNTGGTVADGSAIIVSFDYETQQKVPLPVSVRGQIHEVEKGN